MPHSMRVLSCSLSGTSARAGGAGDATVNSPPRPPIRRSSRSSRLIPVARGGGNLFGPGGGGGEGRLIIPGQQGGGRGAGGGGASGGRLIIPGQGGARPGRGGGPGGGPGGGTAPGRGGGGGGGRGVAGPDSPSVFGAPPPPPPGASPIGVTLDAPSTANFRPPPGFMEKGAEATWILGAGGGGASSSTSEPFDVDVALSRIRARAGPWHQLAALLPQLSSAGIDAMAVEVETGLERATQALWQTAAQVFASLKSDKLFPAAALQAFDSAPGAPALHELRNLPADARRGAAEYLATGGEMAGAAGAGSDAGGGILEAVDTELASRLARAYREWERRAREREGFSDAPGDVLAFKHWRDAAECRREDAKEEALKKGLAVAVTSAARERLESLSTEAIARVVPAAEAAAAAAAAGLLRTSAEGGGKLLPLTISRLQPAETLFVPVPLLSLPLGSATAEALAALPSARQTGPFGAFGGAGGGTQFVVLPSWTTVQGLSGLAAIPIDDLSCVPEIVAAAVVASGVVGSKKIEEEKEKLKGPGLLVVDRDGGSKARARSTGSKGMGPSGVGAAVLAVSSEERGVLTICDVEVADAARDAKSSSSSAATVLFVVRPPKVAAITETDSGTASFEM